MAHIEYLGFVVRHDSKAPENVIAACIAKLVQAGQTKWKAYPPGDHRFIPMLFIASVTIKQKLAEPTNVEEGVPAGKILIRKPDPRLDFVLDHLYDVGSKPRDYESLPDDLKAATKHFFGLHGRKDRVRLEAPQDGLRPEQIFFWTVGDFLNQTGEGSFPSQPTQIQVDSDPPQSNPHILLGIPNLAETVRLHLARPKPWHVLYQKANRAPDDLPTYRIPLYGLPTVPAEEGGEHLARSEQPMQLPEVLAQHREILFTRPSARSAQPMQLPEVLAQHRKILLTGPSGSGKTTILKMLAADQLRLRRPTQRGLPIFISLKYVGVEGKSVIDLVVDTVVRQILTSKSRGLDIPQEVAIRRALHGDYTDTASLFASEVRDFFARDTDKADGRLLLILDGYNEMSDAEKDKAEHEIRQLATRVDNIVVSAHPHGTPANLPGFTRFDLEPLSNEQIASYADAHLDGSGPQFFDDIIARDSRILSMARIPVYIELLLDYRKTYPDRTLPAYAGSLMGYFIERQYAKKKPERQRLCQNVTDRDIDFFLRKLAYGLMDRGSEKGETVLSYPDDVLDLCPSSTMGELTSLIRAAEITGFIEQANHTHGERITKSCVSFRHEKIRDYFAAMELLQWERLDGVPVLQQILERDEWEGILHLYFGLIRDRERLRDDLHTVAQSDPFQASRCLISAGIRSEDHASDMLQVFSTDRLAAIASSFVDGTPYSIRRALADILSFSDATSLRRLFHSTATDTWIRYAIPWAIIRNQHQDALAYFRSECNQYDGDPLGLICALSLLGTDEQWLFICQSYIEALEARGSTCCLPGNAASCEPAELIASWIYHVKSLLRTSATGRDFVLRIETAMLSRIVKNRSENMEAVVCLLASSDRTVSMAAFKVLAWHRHPKVMPDIRESLNTGFMSGPLPIRDMMTLVSRLCDPEIDATLWQRFVREVTSNGIVLYLNIPEALSKRTDRLLLNDTLAQVLETEGILALLALNQFSLCDAERTCEYMRERTGSLLPHSSIWNRCILTRGLCRDATVVGEICAMLENLDSIRWEEEKGHIISEDQEDDADRTLFLATFFEMVLFFAVERMALREAIPILIRMKETSSDVNRRACVSRTLDSLRCLLVESRSDARFVAEDMRLNCADVRSYCRCSERLSDLMQHWTEDTCRLVLRELRDVVETIIQKQTVGHAPLLYCLISGMRTQLGQRYLDVFAGWPFSTPIDSHNMSANGGQEGCH